MSNYIQSSRLNHMVPTSRHSATAGLSPATEPQNAVAAQTTTAIKSVVELSPTLSLAALKRDRPYLPIVGWDDIVNIGDQVILDVADRIFNYRPRRVSNDIDHMLGIGSLFFMASTKSYIWGSGILTSDEPIPEITPRRIRALRGMRTADRLTREGYRLPDVPFGDPGIFVSECVSCCEADRVRMACEIIVIPHHSTYAAWASGRFAGSMDVEILDPCTNKIDFLKKIVQANIVISESLHGLVFATAFKKKVVWIGDADADLFKYHDWFSMVESPPLKPLDPNTDIDQLVSAARTYDHSIRTEDLRRNFPHEVAVHLDEKRIGYEAARDQQPLCFFFQDQRVPLIRGGLSATLCFDLAASVADVIFDCWDDRPYALGMAHRSAILPNRRQLDRIIYEMNHHLYNTFAVIASEQQVAQAGLQMHPLADGLSWAFGDLTDISTVLIRPSGKRRGDHYVIFFI